VSVLLLVTPRKTNPSAEAATTRYIMILTIVVWLFLFRLTWSHSHFTGLRVTTSNVSSFGDNVWSLACSHTCVKLGDGLTWRMYFWFRTARLVLAVYPFKPCISGYWSARAVIILVLIKKIEGLLRKY